MSLSKKKRLKVYEKYGHCCAYCGCYLKYSEMQVDHIKPMCRGNGGGFVPNDLQGEDVMDNYNPSCRMCNFRKGMLRIEEFRAELSRGLEVLEKNFTYRMMRRYRKIVEVPAPILFHFEIDEDTRKTLEKIIRLNHGDEK